MFDVLSFPDIALLAGPVYLLLIAIEAWFVRKARWRGTYQWNDSACSIALGVGSGIATALWGGFLLGVVGTAWEARIATIPVSSLGIAIAFVVDDFRYYWWHRISHRVRWFWAAHVVHHSSQRYNLGTALRQPWTDRITGLFLLGVPLVWIGFHPAVLAFVYGLNLFYQFWIHTEAIDRLPAWFESVFNTPSHHRVHHGTNPRYLDANYAGTLIVWDKMFGTFVPETDREEIVYGLVHQLETLNPIRVAFHEYLAIARDQWNAGLRLSERMGYLFGVPGYSHDGSRHTSDALKAAYVNANPGQSGAAGLPLLGRSARA